MILSNILSSSNTEVGFLVTLKFHSTVVVLTEEQKIQNILITFDELKVFDDDNKQIGSKDFDVVLAEKIDVIKKELENLEANENEENA